MADGQGGVFIRAAGQRFIDEKMARHGGHGVQDALVGDALAAQTLHHRLAQAVGVQAQVAAGSRHGRLGLTRQGRRGNAGIAIGGRDAGAEPAGVIADRAGPARHRLGDIGLAYAFAHSGSAQVRISSSWLCWVRSRRRGVTDTVPCSTAWKSVPGVASAARPTGPIQ
ncbi:hypothetical protein G6F46_013749 [Rhizopus delemar]|nr:hypothetical protein G6F46_013749 [Rhizopus delemar]